jgi:hypothetical protein
VIAESTFAVVGSTVEVERAASLRSFPETKGTRFISIL